MLNFFIAYELLLIFETFSNLIDFLSIFQVELFAGIRHVIIHVVANGLVMPHLLDRLIFDKYMSL